MCIDFPNDLKIAKKVLNNLDKSMLIKHWKRYIKKFK